MALPKRIYLDTNVLIEMIEGSGPRSQRLIELFSGNDGTLSAYLFTSELTLAEVLVTPMALGLNSLIQSYDNVLNNSAVLQVGLVDREVLSVAAFIRSQHRTLKLPDAIHVATALNFGCSHLLSADKKLSGQYEMPRINRQAIQVPATVHVIRPDDATLAGLSSEFYV